MPKKMEKKLKAQAKKMGLGKERTDAYVYGTMRKAGWKPGGKKEGVASHTDPIAEKALKTIYKNY